MLNMLNGTKRKDLIFQFYIGNPGQNVLRKLSRLEMFSHSAVTKEMELLDIFINRIDQTYRYMDHSTG